MITQNELTKKQMAFLATSRFASDKLSPDQISGLTRAQISWLTPDQISWLSRAQISWLTRAQISWLSPDQISGLTRAQISKIENILEDVPTVPRLYTKILEVVRREMGGKLDQSTFGECNRGKSACGSPMCIGGTTVFLAGEKGYKLADLFGFETAARLIHLKSRPDAPVPRYDNYPNEWALAFVEERAQEETAA